MKSMVMGLMILVGLSLSACENANQGMVGGQREYAQEEVYEGYPCGKDCIGFKSGYETALSQGFRERMRCEEMSKDEQLGCEAFVVDYKYENKSFEELLQNL